MEPSLLQLGALLLAPVALVLLLPRRWLRLAMILWAVSPAFAYAVVAGWELMTRKADSATAANAAHGFLIIASLAAVPWLIACALGFGLGFLLRRALGRDGPALNERRGMRARPR